MARPQRVKLDKKEFFKTELGEELEETIRCWDHAMAERKKSKAGYRRGESDSGLGFEYWDRTCQSCLDKWEVFKLAIKQFYEVEYNFTRTEDYFGLVTEDGTDWLLKEDREA